jgi:trans-aconitate methyltransferase
MRIPEANPLMIDMEQCRAYNKYASDPVQLYNYVEAYESLIGIKSGTVIDLGSGTCNFTIALAKKFPNLEFTCYEASDAMLAIAKENIDKSDLSARIRLVKDDIKNATGKYDVVLANRLLHHINETESFWQLINSLSDTVLVIDINRPPQSVVEHIRKVDEYQEPVYKEDLINSMQAAYSIDEVTEQIKDYNYNIATDHCYRLFVYHTR